MNEGDELTYRIDVTNPLGGLPEPIGDNYGGFTGFTVFASGNVSGVTSTFVNPANALGSSEPDGLFSSVTLSGNTTDNLYGGQFDLTTNTGNITKVELIVWAQVSAALNDDGLNVYTKTSGGSFVSQGTVTAGQLTTSLQQFTFDVTDANPSLAGQQDWSWADFLSTANSGIQIETKKTGGPDGKTVYVDAMAFKITTDSVYGSANSVGSFNSDTTLSEVPLVDTYDPAKLKFILATVAPTSIDEGTGTLTWSNIGAINGTETKSIEVTFEALEPSGNATDTNVANAATVTMPRLPMGSRPARLRTRPLLPSILRRRSAIVSGASKMGLPASAREM